MTINDMVTFTWSIYIAAIERCHFVSALKDSPRNSFKASAHLRPRNESIKRSLYSWCLFRGQVSMANARYLPPDTRCWPESSRPHRKWSRSGKWIRHSNRWCCSFFCMIIWQNRVALTWMITIQVFSAVLELPTPHLHRKAFQVIVKATRKEFFEETPSVLSREEQATWFVFSLYHQTLETWLFFVSMIILFEIGSTD